MPDAIARAVEPLREHAMLRARVLETPRTVRAPAPVSLEIRLKAGGRAASAHAEVLSAVSRAAAAFREQMSEVRAEGLWWPVHLR